MLMESMTQETRFRGLPLSPGVVVARVCLFNEKRHMSLPVRDITPQQVQGEGDRFRKALLLVREKLVVLAREVQERVGKAESEIFTVQKMILDDPAMIERVTDHIRSKNFSAEKAVMSSLDYFEEQIAKTDNAYLKERASDISEIKRRLLDALSDLKPSFQCQGDSFCQKGKNRVVIAGELTPSLTMELNTDSIKGFVTDRGGVASHAAILARALRIPAVSGIPGIHDKIFCGTEVLVDGDTGEVVVWPSPKTLAQYPNLSRGESRDLKPVDPVPGIKVYANLNLAKQAGESAENRAEGIGLYRTEFEFFAARKLLNEDEQYERYKQVLEVMKDRPVYFRMLDLGGDKEADFLEFPHEQNPVLGLRGSRFLLEHPELFREQARALARASRHGRVHVMYPMVIDLEQYRNLVKRFKNETADISSGEIRHGLMFEVPSACLEAESILKEADFGSIGTNDLIQYLFAVDRDNEWVAYDHHPDRKIFWKLIHDIAKAAKKHRKPLSVCGEIASNPEYVRQLIREGIRTVSVAPRAITRLRVAIKNKPELRKRNGRNIVSARKKTKNRKKRGGT
ncbi:MAG: Phosphoenolpyruvate-protein phosphotransferase [Candidatus Omnitrophica bacterium ADurb.Bin292]|nr:MAG: Phosphoenolpyruvate-protein phosphotransferase [Candidatus Omnitrophica bacterium ADurb.Bin292]